MRKLLFALLAAAAALALLWRLFPPEEDTKSRLTRHAGVDLVAACNDAAAQAGEAVRFTAEDVRPIENLHEGRGGVAVLVSVLEARRGGLACRWDGIDAPTLTRAQ